MTQQLDDHPNQQAGEGTVAQSICRQDGSLLPGWRGGAAYPASADVSKTSSGSFVSFVAAALAFWTPRAPACSSMGGSSSSSSRRGEIDSCNQDERISIIQLKSLTILPLRCNDGQCAD